MYCNTCQDILYLTDPPPRPQLKRTNAVYCVIQFECVTRNCKNCGKKYQKQVVQ
jgi:hypothetical protein